eukprot:42738_1
MKWRFVLGIFLVFVIKSGSLANLMEAESGHLGSPEPKQQDGGDSGEFNMFDMLANIDDGDSESVDDNESDPADYEDDDFFDDDESDSADSVDQGDMFADSGNGGKPTIGGKHTNDNHIEVVSKDKMVNHDVPKEGVSHDKITIHGNMMPDQGTDCTNADGCGARQDCIAKGGQKKCVCRSNGNLAPLMAECPQPVCGDGCGTYAKCMFEMIANGEVPAPTFCMCNNGGGTESTESPCAAGEPDNDNTMTNDDHSTMTGHGITFNFPTKYIVVASVVGGVIVLAVVILVAYCLFCKGEKSGDVPKKAVERKNAAEAQV